MQINAINPIFSSNAIKAKSLDKSALKSNLNQNSLKNYSLEYENLLSNINRANISFKGSPVKGVNNLVQSFQAMQKANPDFSIEKAIKNAMPEVKTTPEMLKGVNSTILDFLRGDIEHLELQTNLVNLGLPLDKAGKQQFDTLFKNLFSKMPNIKSRNSINPNGEVYRCITKPEYDKLISGEPVQCKGYYLDITTNPTLDFHSYARVKFKPQYNALNKGNGVLPHKKEQEYYWLAKENYSFDDVEFVDRILPTGYLEMYKAKDVGPHQIKGANFTMEELEQKVDTAQNVLSENWKQMQQEHPEITIENILKDLMPDKTFTSDEISQMNAALDSFLNNEIDHWAFQIKLCNLGYTPYQEFFDRLFSLMPNFTPSPKIAQEPVQKALKKFDRNVLESSYKCFPKYVDLSKCSFAKDFETKVLNGELDTNALYEIYQKDYSINYETRIFLDELFEKHPDLKPATNSQGTIYRHISKSEYDKLLDELKVKSLSASEGGRGWGNVIDVTTNPMLNIHDFARITFNDSYKKGAPLILEHKPENEYYHLNKNYYDIFDIKSIERKLPNGFLEVYSVE